MFAKINCGALISASRSLSSPVLRASSCKQEYRKCAGWMILPPGVPPVPSGTMISILSSFAQIRSVVRKNCHRGSRCGLLGHDSGAFILRRAKSMTGRRALTLTGELFLPFICNPLILGDAFFDDFAERR